MADENLIQIRGVGEKIAEKLQAGGFDTVEKVASAREEELLKAGLVEREVKGIIASAKELSGGQKKEESFWRFG